MILLSVREGWKLEVSFSFGCIWFRGSFFWLDQCLPGLTLWGWSGPRGPSSKPVEQTGPTWPPWRANFTLCWERIKEVGRPIWSGYSVIKARMLQKKETTFQKCDGPPAVRDEPSVCSILQVWECRPAGRELLWTA